MMIQSTSGLIDAQQNEIANQLDEDYEGSAGLYPDDRKIHVGFILMPAQ